MTAITGSDVVAMARGWIGTPYHDQASLAGAGCDCLGLARGLWRQIVGPEPEAVPPYSRDWGEVARREVMIDGAMRWMVPVPTAQAMPGDVLIFRMRPRAIAKHCAILTGTGSIVHAREGRGVIEEPLTDWWRRRIVAACRYPGVI